MDERWSLPMICAVWQHDRRTIWLDHCLTGSLSDWISIWLDHCGDSKNCWLFQSTQICFLTASEQSLLWKVNLLLEVLKRWFDKQVTVTVSIRFVWMPGPLTNRLCGIRWDQAPGFFTHQTYTVPRLSGDGVLTLDLTVILTTHTRWHRHQKLSCTNISNFIFKLVSHRYHYYINPGVISNSQD